MLSVATGVLIAACTASVPVERSPARQSTAKPSAIGGLEHLNRPCGHATDTVAAPPPDLTVVAGVVALPIGSVLPANPFGDTDPRLFAKSGLVVRADAVVGLRVPGSSAGRLWIGWGSPGRISMEVWLTGCPDRSGWLAFAGG